MTNKKTPRPPHPPPPPNSEFLIREEYAVRPGETQTEALRSEILILIDYALQVGMEDDEIDQVFREVFDARAEDRRKGFKIV